MPRLADRFDLLMCVTVLVRPPQGANRISEEGGRGRCRPPAMLRETLS
jgi:hypothetical protein